MPYEFIDKELTKEEEDELVSHMPTTAIKTEDSINPDYYTKMNIPPNVYITANELEWEVGCVVKYISRYKGKNGLEDLRKAKKYLELLAERVYGEEL